MTKRDLLIDFLEWYQRNTQEEGTCNEKWMDEATVDSYLNQPQLQQHGVVRGGVFEMQSIHGDRKNLKYPDWIERKITPTEPLATEARDTVREAWECKVCGKPFGDKLTLFYHYDEVHNSGEALSEG